MADEDDPYDCVMPGKLKVKSGKVKKKKKKKKNKAEEVLDYVNKSKDDEVGSSSSNHETDGSSVKKTAAELAYEKAQEKRAAERILKKASKTHKQRVEELNEYLGGLSEHYDVQKVSWTK